MTANFRDVAFAVAAPILVTILIGRALPKERRPPVLWLCAAGAATAYLAFLLEGFAVPALLGTSAHYLSPLELAFGLVGPIEEIVKIPVLQSQLTSHQNFSGRSAAIMGTAIGSGFAALENAMYFYSAGPQWADLALTRLLTAAPFHMANGAIAGIPRMEGCSRRPSPRCSGRARPRHSSPRRIRCAALRRRRSDGEVRLRARPDGIHRHWQLQETPGRLSGPNSSAAECPHI
jgi:hypothetical protein